MNFTIYQYDWGQVFHYIDPGKLQFWNSDVNGTYWVLDDNTSTSTFHGTYDVFDYTDSLVFSAMNLAGFHLY